MQQLSLPATFLAQKSNERNSYPKSHYSYPISHISHLISFNKKKPPSFEGGLSYSVDT